MGWGCRAAYRVPTAGASGVLLFLQVVDPADRAVRAGATIPRDRPTIIMNASVCHNAKCP